MTIEEVFNNVDASTPITSTPINMEKRTNWDLVIDTDSVDGEPRIILEVGYNLGECHGLPTDWFAVENTKDCTFVFDIDTTPTIIKKKEQTANWFRVRLEPNGNTAGTLNALLGYKDYP